ncbi:TetR/AcrR family transcriptional regulator [Catenulispora subtropica]|uniref:TetR/AcrR family transcriptional regulator n=2 Tax=Catenulispora subtropica TaxID=450798 RepID=A0ABP5CBZ2_9ACTN
MDLFVERGYDQTTVADIAMRAGLTERTFFRHFADKREVLFYGGPVLQDRMVGAVEAAPPEAAPLTAVAAGVTAVAPMFAGRHAAARLRQSIIDSHPELQEREVAKLAHLAEALADALRARGVPDPAARLAADSGIAVFRAAFAQWVTSPAGDMRPRIDECFDEFVKIAEAVR